VARTTRSGTAKANTEQARETDFTVEDPHYRTSRSSRRNCPLPLYYPVHNYGVDAKFRVQIAALYDRSDRFS
jgi:hypothetical protein